MHKPLLFLCWLVCLLLAVSSIAQTPVISSTLSVSLTGDVNNNGQVNPADQLSYSLVISNTGSGSATGVNLTMPAPANTTLVTGSLKTSALARPDSYTTLINGPLNATTVLTNDFGLPTKTVVSFGPSATPVSTLANGTNTALSDQGGTVLMQTNGSFTYTPTGSFVGYDKFGYTAMTTTPPNDAATVTVGVGTPVTAVANSYTITGNVSNTQLAGTGVLVNDTGDQKMVTAVNGLTANVGVAVTTTQSGTVTVAADGSFAYNPPAGYSGPDSFTYTANNGLALPSSAVVSLTIQDMIWFVNSAAGAGGTGTLAKPFNTLAAFQTVNNGSGNNPAAGDNIFLYSGSYTGGVSLLNTQKLIGAGATATLASIADITLAPGSAPLPATGQADPTISNASGNSVSVASGNLIRGLTIGTGSANALVGNSFGTLTVADLTINAAGRALALTTGAVSGSFDSVTSTAGTNNITLTTITGSFSINAGVLSGASASSFSVNGGSVNVFYSGGLNQANNAALVSVVGGHSGTLTFSGSLNATNGAGLQFDNADGTYNFTGTTSLNGGDAGIDIVNGSGGTFAFPTTTITNPSGIAYREDSSSPTVTFGSTIRKDNNSNSAVVINAKSSGSTTFSNSITASTGTANAIDLTNTGGTVSFSGGSLFIVTTSGTGFNAIGSGQTVSVTGATNTLSSPNGTALNVTNTTIGGSGLTFLSISSASSAAPNGIILSNTGSSGGLTVTGTGTAGSGGTIANKTGSDGSATTGCGIYLNNTVNPSFTRMQLNNFQNHGIYGSTVSGFTLSNCIINGVNGTNSGTPFNESSVYFLGLTGSVSVTNCNISGGWTNNFYVSNSSGSLNRITFTSTTIGANSTTDGNDGVIIEGLGSATVNVTIQNCFFTSSRGDLFQMIADGSGGGDLVLMGSAFSNNHPGIATGGGGVSIAGGAGGAFTLNIDGNSFRDAVGPAFLLVHSVGLGNVTVTLNNNTIGVAGIANSGSLEGAGMKLQHAGSGSLAINNAVSRFTLNVTNNQVRQYNNEGILTQAGAGIAYSGNIIATISGNTLANPGNNVSIGNIFQGLNLNGGVTPGDNFLICFNVGANVITNSGRNGGVDFRIRQRQSTTVRLPGYAGANNDNAAVATFIQSKLVTAATGSALSDITMGGGGFIGTNCQ